MDRWVQPREPQAAGLCEYDHNLRITSWTRPSVLLVVVPGCPGDRDLLSCELCHILWLLDRSAGLSDCDLVVTLGGYYRLESATLLVRF